jgi:hypothetical protein
MGFEIQLQDEYGNPIAGISDPMNFLARLLPANGQNANYPMLGSIDLYGDTVFNRLQIPRFLAEWVYVASTARTQEERELVLEIARLGRRCSDEVHTYLKFVGD